jgi:hypothetical protein
VQWRDTVEAVGQRDDEGEGGQAPCDLSTVCWNCGAVMEPEHAHYRCSACGWRDSCCDGPH